MSGSSPRPVNWAACHIAIEWGGTKICRWNQKTTNHVLHYIYLLLSEALLMKKGSTLFLKFVICLIAIGALIWLIWFPQLEGRAANLDLISIYKDPLIIYTFIASTPFFVALYQAFKLLGYVDNNKVFSQSSVNAVRNIKYCAFIISGLI